MEKNPFTPSKPKVTKINKNLHKLAFKFKGKDSKKTSKKSLLFLHLFNKEINKLKDINKMFKILVKHSKNKVNNVLYIADHLQPKSLYVLKHLIRKYMKLTWNFIEKITYRRIRVFWVRIHHHRK